MAAVVCACEHCGESLTVSGRGRRARWCDDVCRMRAARAVRLPNGLDRIEEALVYTIRTGNRPPDVALLLMIDAWREASA